MSAFKEAEDLFGRKRGKSNHSPIGSSWDEVRAELFTPEEIAESDLRVALVGEQIKAQIKRGASSPLHYKGYAGSVEYSDEDGVFFGQVLGIRSLLSYEGDTVEALEADFRCLITEYLDYCEKEGRMPEKPDMF